ncbi:condensin complex subunit 2 isoform X2 [Bombina bombina]|uniref:condensin complex subunit 2 isoform X2 n=1 Tax=Bombina bombina TaxID=8345 RepID=UPI00235A6EF0|nr:condensin complex subunit 2 isoform X2 [Bombina bombina]
MSISTPQSGGRHHQDTPDSVYLSPSTRRQPGSATGTPTLQNFTSNDDEKERKQRRKSRVIDLQLSGVDSPASTISPSQRADESTISLLPKLTNNQISDHYSTCIKLSQENKITTKNAFGLHLIDYMGDILKQKDSELTNFKVAAGTLDASAKIYAVRVDAVHADVYKVLGGLGKESNSPDGTVDHDPDASKETLDDKKNQKKRKRSYRTIEKNVGNINRAEVDRKTEIDPLFQRSAASFDEFSTAGVFLSTMRCYDYHSELRFDSDVKPLATIQEAEPPSPGQMDMSELKSLLSQCVEKRPLCPSLSGFRFTQWDQDLNETPSSLMDKLKSSDHIFDINAEVVEDDYEEAPGTAMDDFDADVCDGNEPGDLGEFDEQREACRAERKGPQVTQIAVGDIGTMCLQLSSCPGEYSYFSPRTMSMWAGPEHWRFRPRQKTETETDKQKVKKAKKVFELNFDEDISFDVHFRKTRAATTLAKSTLESQNKKSTTLPADFHYDPDNIVKLSLRPVDRVKRVVSQASVSELEDEIGEYDYNNPNDTSNFCPALQADDSDDDDAFMGSEGVGINAENGIIENHMNITSYGEDNLVAEPHKVNKIEIQYAKTAKKMDMKRLKTTMWSLLTNTKLGSTDTVEEVSKDEPETAVVTDESVFSNVTKDLQKRLPPIMAQNLSVPLAFACLLHLANEKNLKLQGVEDLSDVMIMQGD